jgi:Predicted methyltransferases
MSSERPGTLYLIPTPLGEDAAALAALPEQVKTIAARLDTFVVEHPKTARRHLKQFGVPRPLQEITLLTLNEHTPPQELDALLQPLLQGKDVGLMSEAGCPAVADPGAALVQLAHRRGIPVVPLAGPSSLLLALMGSGLNGQSFAFHGYLPVEKEQRAKKLRELEDESRRHNRTQLFIETPYRNQHMLADILAVCRPGTLLTVAADLTQPAEYLRTYSVAEWKKQSPDLDKRPAIFLLLSPA